MISQMTYAHDGQSGSRRRHGSRTRCTRGIRGIAAVLATGEPEAEVPVQGDEQCEYGFRPQSDCRINML